MSDARVSSRPGGARLDAIGARIETLSTDPDSVRARWTRLVGPVLRRVGWRPRFTTERLAELVAALRAERIEQVLAEDRLAEALEELEDNVAAAERACAVHRRVPVAHAAWLARLLEVVRRAARAVEAPSDATARRVVGGLDAAMIAPPLALASAVPRAPAEGGPTGAAGEEAAAAEAAASAELDLELAAVDHLLDAARAEREFLGRRRRLLEAARLLLLESSAALPLAAEGVEARRRHIASEIVLVDRLEAAGIAPEVGVVHQARSAIARGERQRLYAALVAMDATAIAAGDAAVAARTGPAVDRLWGEADARGKKAVRSSVKRSAAELFGASAVDAIRRAYQRAREELPRSAAGMNGYERDAHQIATTYLAKEHEPGALSALLESGGAFEVGGTLSPLRVIEHELSARLVPYPTADLTLVPARHVSDLPSAVVEDPRLLVLDLARGRLLTRRYVTIERRPRARTVMVGEARVYVLDGSGSMHATARGVPGARARVRDAILLAELATLRARCEDPRRSTRVVLYYRYFNDEVGPLRSVSTADGAVEAMGDVAARVRTGGTDIEAALVASFDQVREARGDDPDLARAQIVLITDGEARVREDLIDEARRGLEDLPIGVSVIALGQENPALRGIVARQRARGERAFYHYLDDHALAAMASGDLAGQALHLPGGAGSPGPETARELEEALGGLVEELADVERARHAEAIEAAEAHAQALAELGLDAAGGATAEPLLARGAGRAARIDAAIRDRRALEARFARWFPRPSEQSSIGATALGDDDAQAALVALSVVAEVVGELGGGELSRKADAIELLERLLPDARLSPARYAKVLADHAPELGPALAAVHRVVAPPPAPGARKR